jgi:TPR repeat protein
MAFRCFVESAKRGDIRGGTLLAYFYECGYGTIVNKDKARYWYEKSAEKGEPYAQEALERIK